MSNSLILRALSSKKVALILMAVYTVMIVVATIIEDQQGTPVAKALIYYSPLFLFLQFFMVLNFIFVTINYKLISNKKWSYLITHASYVIILFGALVTHLTSEEGLMHIREGEKTSNIVYEKDGKYNAIKLPFEVELLDFTIVRYPGSQSPSSYESLLRVHDGENTFDQRVFMNNVLDLKGYRFYQASYDPDELGTILSVNYDVPGRIITYIGYFLLTLSAVFMLFDKHSRFRTLWYKLENRTEDEYDEIQNIKEQKSAQKEQNKKDNKTLKSFMILGLCALLGFSSVSNEAHAEGADVSLEHAKLFGELPMQSNNGRIEPINTFASEFIRKFKANSIIGNLEPEQVLLSIMAYPADWAVMPFIEVKDKEIAKKYGFPLDKRISYRDAFDEKGFYRLAHDVERVYIKNPAERNHLDREILKLDDKVNIFHELLTNRMLRLFPNPNDTVNNRWFAAGERDVFPNDAYDKEVTSLMQTYLHSIAKARANNNWEEANLALQKIREFQDRSALKGLIDNTKLKTERLYNNLELPKKVQIAYFLIGLFMFIAFFIGRREANKNSKKDKLVKNVLTSLAMIAFIVHTVSLIIRWYISGYAPWSNSYETMVFLSWAGVLCGFVFVRRNFLVVALSVFFGGFVLLVSTMSWMDPQITPLVPVLKSPWLLAHVAILVIAYGFLGICCMIGAAHLVLSILRKERFNFILNQITIINELSMILGTAFLAVGIFLGAIWANESWGRYWSWDPKESWALITLIVYAIVLHIKWALKCSDYTFNLLSQQSFLAVLMTFLGVNYFLSGMHSYGSNDALSGIPILVYIIFFTFFVLPGLLAYIVNRKNLK